MKVLKKVLLSLICMSLVLSSGCGNNSETVESNSDIMEITWLGIPWYPNGQEGSYAQKLIEDKFNVKITPIFMDDNGYKTKKTVMLSSGETPDLIYELDPAYVQQDAKQGFIAEVPYDIIKEKAPTAFSIINEHEVRAWAYSRVDNKNYGVPNLDYAGIYPYVAQWRADWLKNVGIDKVPETLTEMHDALYKFTYSDPDGNGKKDTYGMTGTIDSWASMFNDVFGAFGSQPFNWVERNGKIVYGGLLPETKEAIKTLAQWYKEGIIHPDFITDTDSSKYINGIVGYHNTSGGVIDEDNPGSAINTMRGINPKVEVVNGVPISGPNGDAGRFVWSKAAHVIAFGKHLEEQPDKFEKLLGIIEALCTDDDLAEKVRMGEKGKHWDYKDSTLQAAGGIHFLPPYDQGGENAKELLGGAMNAFTFYGLFPSSYDAYEKSLANTEKELNETVRAEKYAKLDYFLKPDALPSSGKYLSDLRNKQISVIAKIIRGENSIDSYSEFEQYWATQGGSVLEKEAQEMNKTFNTIKSEVGVN